MRSILLHAWTLHKINNEYYIAYTHWIYLKEIVKYYDRIGLLSPIKNEIIETTTFESLKEFDTIEIYELPYSKGYLDAVKFFFKYTTAYKKLSNSYDTVYARYPIPFGWLQKFYFKRKKRIIHFVGDPIDTIVQNPNLSYAKKKLYTIFFKPEHYLFIQACKTATVYTNGFHISEKLKKQGIIATPLVSSTISDSDFYFENKNLNLKSPRIIYVGYLRKAKGVDIVLKAFSLLQKEKPDASLTIVGDGESYQELQKFTQENNIEHVNFTGHIDSRIKLNQLLRSNDIFCFASLSEGSPRVILEAMANGLAVVSTPVGSLPYIFENNKNIMFADFNNPTIFKDKLLELSSNEEKYYQIRSNAYLKVSDFKIDKFIKTIFHES